MVQSLQVVITLRLQSFPALIAYALFNFRYGHAQDYREMDFRALIHINGYPESLQQGPEQFNFPGFPCLAECCIY